LISGLDRILQRRDHQRGVNRAGRQRSRHLAERNVFELNVGERQAAGLEDLRQLVEQDGAAGGDRDRAALEVGGRPELAPQVRADHEVVGIRAGRPRHQDADREAFAQRIEEAGRNGAADHLNPVGREQHRHVARGSAHLQLHVDARFAVVAFLQRHIERRTRERRIVPDHDLGGGLGEGFAGQASDQHGGNGMDSHRCSL
jgi:hypothetical protein